MGPFHALGSGLVSPGGLYGMCEHGEMVVECSGRLLGLEWVESRPMGRCSDRKQVGWRPLSVVWDGTVSHPGEWSDVPQRSLWRV